MNFVINSTVTDGQTIKANTTYTLSNGYTETIDVPVFAPVSFADVINAVHSRGLTIQSQHG